MRKWIILLYLNRKDERKENLNRNPAAAPKEIWKLEAPPNRRGEWRGEKQHQLAEIQVNNKQKVAVKRGE